MRTESRRGRANGAGVWLLGALACSLAAPSFAQGQPTVEQLQQRLEALERRLGAVAGPIAAEGGEGKSSLGDLNEDGKTIFSRPQVAFWSSSGEQR